MKDVVATVIVNLEKDEEELFNNLQKDARWGIKRAKKEGLTIRESEDFNSFYEIYVRNMNDLGVKPETLEHVKHHSNILFLCYKEDKIIAGAVLEIVDNVPTLTRATSLSEYRNYQPNNLLYWQCMLWSKNHGYRKLDLGGWQIKARGHLEGVNKFKERWGEVVYINREFPFFVAIGRKLIRNSSFFWWLNKKIRRRK